MNRVDEIFARALESDAGARAALLEAECGGDVALRTEVESLLSAHAEMGQFMGRSAAGSLGAMVPCLEPGEIVGGGYRVVRLVGEGGSGAVYEAIQANPERRVALKVMRAGPASEVERERFAREARILARLKHPAVATIYEAGVEERTEGVLSWFALEYVEGSRSLLDYAGELPTHDRLALFARICDAIHHGHQQGLLHRDIKPGNLLIGAGDRPKVIDFGIARTIEESAAGEVAGTTPYMSPEQRAGGPLDVRSDVYSLGVVLRDLFGGGPGREVASIVGKALADEPDARYVSAAALGEDVRRYLAHEPVAAHPQGPLYRVGKFARRQRLAFGAILAVLVVSVAAAVVGTGLALKQARAVREAEFNSYVANIAAASGALRIGDVAEARRRLSQAPARLRGWEWHHFMRRVDLSARTLTWPDAQIWTGAVSPDGVFVAAFGIDKQDPTRVAVRIWDRASGRALRTLPVTELVQAIAFSRDGGRLALGYVSGRIEVQGTRDGSRSVRLEGHEAEVNAIVFGANRLVSASRDRTVRVWSLPTGEPVHTLRGHTDRVICLCLAPDGRRALSGGREGALCFWDLDEGKLLAVVEAHDRSVEGVDWSRDGQTVVSACRDGTVAVWDAASRRRTATLRGHTDVARDVAIAPDGSTVVTASYDRTVRLWDVAAGAERTTFRGHADKIVKARFTPDGRRVVSVSQDGTVKEWPVAGLDPVPTLRGHEDAINDVAFGFGFAVTGSNDGSVRLWDAATGRPHRILARAAHAIRALACGTRTVHACVATVGLRTWSVPNGELLWGADGVTAIAALRDRGQVVAGAAGGKVVVFDASSGEVLRRWPAHGATITHVAAREDRIVTSTPYGEVSVWGLDGSSIAKLRATAWPVALTISPDGRTVAVGYYSGDIALYDIETLRRRKVLTGHARVTDLVYWPDGGRLAAGGWDGTIRLWDPVRGETVAVLQGHRHSVRGLALSPDGRRLLSGAGRREAPDCVAKIWTAD